MVGGSCGVKNLFALAVPVWRVCARVAPAEPFPGVGLRGGFGAFPCGAKKKVFGAPAAATAQRHRGFGAPPGRGRKKSWG